jgi:lipopolysaccharide heptosyltransferase II
MFARDSEVTVSPRIAVFRALQLGDMLCAVPALRALRGAMPHAHITLIGLPWARSFVERFNRYVDDLLVFPGFPRFQEQPPNLAALPSFFDLAQQRRFDCAIQLHGDGRISNFITTMLGARSEAGFYHAQGYCPDAQRFIPWPDDEPEVRRYLRLLEHLGIPSRGEQLEFPLLPEDVASLHRELTLARLSPRGYVCVHPGARYPSRRWPVERFARVADALVDRGLRVVITGSTDEVSLAGELADSMRMPAINLAGRTNLGGVAALIGASRLLVSNDTGVSHIAAAVGTPSVVVACGSNVRRWAPLDRQRHRVVHHDIDCRPCEHFNCPVGHHCATAISPESVLDEAEKLLDHGHAYAS